MPDRIDWNYPEPRRGLLGVVDKFIGPGATRTEVVLQLGFPIVALMAAPLYAAYIGVDWTPFQYVISGIFAFDILGGVVTNSTSSAKRWYHRSNQTTKDHFLFVVIHLLHLLVISWVYLSLNLMWVIATGGYLLFVSALILSVPLYIQRPVSHLSFAGGILLALYILDNPTGLEWFLPLFFLKLLVSHLPKEEPYRPRDGG